MNANGSGGARWMGVGSSSQTDADAAGREAAAEAVAGRTPKLLVVFASEDLDLTALLDAIRSVTPEGELVGCTTAGEISTAGARDRSVVVSALGGEGLEVATGRGVSATEDLRGAGTQAAQCLEKLAEDHENRFLLMLTDGLAGDQQEIVRGAYSVVGATVPLVGGCAGDSGRMRRTLQMHGSEILQDAVVAAAVSSVAPFGIGVRHGWRRLGDPMLVTGSEGTTVSTIDSRPALDVYLERLGVQGAARTNADAFTEFAQTHPLGLASGRGEEQVRFVSGADFQSRALRCIAHVPEGTLAWFMEGDEESVLEATDAACSDALLHLEGSKPIGMFAFDCIARRGVLGEGRVGDEVARVADHAAGAPVAGFYTYGEIARTSGIAGFHNQTIVVLAVS